VPVTQPVTEPAAKPIPVVPPAQVASNQFNSVAVEGAAIQTAQGAPKPVTQPAAPISESGNEPVVNQSAPADASAPGSTDVRSNIVQRIFAAPRLTSNVIYTILAALVIFALMLNVFMKMKIQHPQLVLNGLMILFAIGTLAIFNQHLLLANAQIF
jgi:hypothetical protein